MRNPKVSYSGTDIAKVVRALPYLNAVYTFLVIFKCILA